ncbi:hypothetical protein HNQ42_000187 [Rummeliibacillus stabekisii]|nr:hypothetical protein [Rummeliibacillus stabekisii]GEL05032.1 hypothetical protein RST01_16590 [Rummeliibacillus stabekisii]
MGCGCGGGKRNSTQKNKSHLTKKHQLKAKQHDHQNKLKTGSRENKSD